MNSSRLLMQRGWKAGGAAASVGLVGAWVAEHSTGRATSRVATRSVEGWMAARQYTSNSSSLLLHRPLSTFTRRNFANKTPAEVAPSPALASATPTPPAAAPAAEKTFLQWYEGHLEASPVKTKMVTGSILWGLGDAVAQLVPHYSSGSEKPLVYDWPRTGRAVLFGFVLHAPTSHVHFNFLEWMTNRAGVTGLGIPVFKAFMEQFVYWSWISNSMYHGAMGAMQGMSAQQIYDRIGDVLWETQKAQWAFWIPVQLLNFRFIPVRHQLNVVLLTSIVWTALLSAWYPPVEEGDGEKSDKEVEATGRRD